MLTNGTFGALLTLLQHPSAYVRHHAALKGVGDLNRKSTLPKVHGSPWIGNALAPAMVLEVRAGIEPTFADLQSAASPLCHRTIAASALSACRCRSVNPVAGR